MEDFAVVIIVLCCLQIVNAIITLVDMAKIEELNLNLRIMALTRESEDKCQK